VVLTTFRHEQQHLVSALVLVVMLPGCIIAWARSTGSTILSIGLEPIFPGLIVSSPRGTIYRKCRVGALLAPTVLILADTAVRARALAPYLGTNSITPPPSNLSLDNTNHADAPG
jgi:hypothetical protein